MSPVLTAYCDGATWSDTPTGPVVAPPRFTASDEPLPGVNIGAIGPESSRNNYAGDLLMQSGQVYRDLNVTGQVIRGNSVGAQLLNVKVLVGPEKFPGGTASTPGIQCWGTGSGTIIEDVEIAPTHPSVGIYGVHGWNFTLRRFHIHDCTDGIVTTHDVVLEGGLVEKVRWWAVDPRQTDGSHCDCWQAEGGPNVTARDIVLDSGVGPDTTRTNGGYGANFGILATQNAALVNGFTVQRVRFRGRPYSHVQSGDSGKGAYTGFSITDSRVEVLSRNAAFRMSPETLAASTFTGNTGPDGTPLATTQVQSATTQR